MLESNGVQSANTNISLVVIHSIIYTINDMLRQHVMEGMGAERLPLSDYLVSICARNSGLKTNKECIPSRWKKLGGGVPNPDEVFKRSEALIYQLEMKKSQLEARQLVLFELDHLAAFLTHEAALSMPETLHLREQVSCF